MGQPPGDDWAEAPCGRRRTAARVVAAARRRRRREVRVRRAVAADATVAVAVPIFGREGARARARWGGVGGCRWPGGLVAREALCVARVWGLSEVKEGAKGAGEDESKAGDSLSPSRALSLSSQRARARQQPRGVLFTRHTPLSTVFPLPLSLLRRGRRSKAVCWPARAGAVSPEVSLSPCARARVSLGSRAAYRREVASWAG